jgi:hypothetical protein
VDGDNNVWEYISELTLANPGEIVNVEENGSLSCYGEHIAFTEAELFICKDPYT